MHNTAINPIIEFVNFDLDTNGFAFVIWGKRKKPKNHWLRMASDESYRDFNKALTEMMGMVLTGLPADGDFKFLYAKYPKCRVGCRRLILIAEKRLGLHAEN